MRQVPHYLLIGNGRLARHFQHYFSLLGISFEAWHRPQEWAFLQQKIKASTHILLLISDQAIEPLIDAIDPSLLTSKTLIHCSGSLATQKAFGAHPLMSFGHTLYTEAQYRTIPFVIDETAPSFAELLPYLPNPHVRLRAELKPKYHALCVLAGNFSTLLWQKLFRDFEKELGLPPHIAHPYLQQLVQNWREDPGNALTGPLVRKDDATLSKNLQALENDPFHPVYQAFVTAYTQLQEPTP